MDDRTDTSKATGRQNPSHNSPAPGPDRRSSDWLPPRWQPVVWYLVMMFVFLWIWQDVSRQFITHTIPYSEFKALLARGQVIQVSIEETEIVGTTTSTNTAATPGRSGAIARTETNASRQSENLTNAIVKSAPATAQNEAKTNRAGIAHQAGKKTPPAATPAFAFRTVRVEDPGLVKELEQHGVEFSGVRPSGISQLLWAWLLPIAVMILLWRFLARRMGSLGQGLMNLGASKAKLVADKSTHVTFEDVAGCDEAKFELQEVVTFLKNPARYQALGATVPKGILLVGPPGTGKTLLARAVAGEAQVPFFLISGSDFVEMFVGVGAARVRDLFEKAKAQAPCIVFIDELDAVGRQRGVHLGMVNDEREQTLNQLLVGMDGFEANVGVIVLAATNRPEVLDRALLRPGRFDRQVMVDAPDLEGRLAILKLHVRNKPLAAATDLRKIAQQTPGFSGADLANLVNEAALLAARHEGTVIDQKDLDDAVEKVVAGPERKSRRLSEADKQRVAYHEVGHALVAAYSQHADAVHKITIIPHGRAALGYTMQLPSEDHYLMNRSALTDRIKGQLGGRAAEEVIFAEVSTGAENDLQQATALARNMVALYGMSKTIGLAHCAQRQNAFGPGMPDGYLQRDCSEQTAREMDEEVKSILDQAYADAKAILQEHRGQLETVTAELLAHETIDGKTFLKLLGREPRKPADLSAACARSNPV